MLVGAHWYLETPTPSSAAATKARYELRDKDTLQLPSLRIYPWSPVERNEGLLCGVARLDLRFVGIEGMRVDYTPTREVKATRYSWLCAWHLALAQLSSAYQSLILQVRKTLVVVKRWGASVQQHVRYDRPAIHTKGPSSMWVLNCCVVNPHSAQNRRSSSSSRNRNHVGISLQQMRAHGRLVLLDAAPTHNLSTSGTMANIVSGKVSAFCAPVYLRSLMLLVKANRYGWISKITRSRRILMSMWPRRPSWPWCGDDWLIMRLSWFCRPSSASLHLLRAIAAESAGFRSEIIARATQ